jgi:hypothetical protein
MIVQVFLQYPSLHLIVVDGNGKCSTRPKYDVLKDLFDQGLALPEGWECTPYGHPIIPGPRPQTALELIEDLKLSLHVRHVPHSEAVSRLDAITQAINEGR